MYNAAETIVRALDSVRAQTFDGIFELIVVNDGSKDNSLRIVQEYRKLHSLNSKFDIILVDQENGGVSKARNKGLALSSGELIAFLDADDEWYPGKTTIQLEYLYRDDIDFIGCARNDETLRIFGKKVEELHKANARELLIKMFPQTSTAIFKRHIYEEIGGYNINLTHAEDGEFWFRICVSYNFYYLPISLVVTGGGKPSFGFSGLSANLEKMYLGNLFILELALQSNVIGNLEYYFLSFFYKVKHYRRVIFTKLR